MGQQPGPWLPGQSAQPSAPGSLDETDSQKLLLLHAGGKRKKKKRSQARVWLAPRSDLVDVSRALDAGAALHPTAPHRRNPGLMREREAVQPPPKAQLDRDPRQLAELTLLPSLLVSFGRASRSQGSLPQQYGRLVQTAKPLLVARPLSPLYLRAGGAKPRVRKAVERFSRASGSTAVDRLRMLVETGDPKCMR